MSGDPEFVVLKYSAWLDATKFEDKILGAIVKHYLDPVWDYVPEFPGQYNHEPLVENSFTDFITESSHVSAHASHLAPIKSIAGLSLKGNTEDKIHLQGKLVRVKRLQKCESFWGRLKKDPVVREHVPGWMTMFSVRKPVCLVTGIMVCEDVDISYEGAASRDTEGHVEFPLAEVMIAAGATPAANLGSNPELRVETRKETATVFKARTGQSKIFALQVKRVTTRFLRQEELVLKGEGPKGPAGRMLSEESDHSDEGEVNVDSLILVDYIL